MSENINPGRKRSLKYSILLWCLFFSPIAILFGLIYLTSAEIFGPLPGFEELQNPKSNLATEIYAADQVVIGKYYRENRVNVNFDKISPHVINALVATEDERYFEHSGIDIKALGRVVFGVITGNISKGGGSTITQQLAKMLFTEKPGNGLERVMQKLKEWIIAIRLEQYYTKEEIIALYLNKFDFVNNAVGIKTASNVYFNLAPNELEIHQAAMLVGMAKNPALFNPLRRPEMVLDRRNVVFKQMHRNNLINSNELDSLRNLPLDINFTRVDHKMGLAPYFREFLRAELKRLFSEKDQLSGNYIYQKPDGSPYDIYSDGLKIYTTIDSRMQAHAEKAVVEHLSKDLQPDFFKDLEKRKNAPFDWRLNKEQIDDILWRSIRQTSAYRSMRDSGLTKEDIWLAFNTKKEMSVFSWSGLIDTIMSPLDSIKYYKSFLQAGMMSMDPTTGFIKAWVGGIDHEYFSYDHVKQGRRQVGSTFKPIVYTLAIQEGFSPCYEVPNTKTCFQIPDQPDWCPKNSDNSYGGMISLKYGLANSINTITAWVMKQFGPKAVVNLARSMGITSPLDEVPALCLGVADLSVYEIVGAYSTFANKGVYIKPTFISRIEDKNGNIIIDFRPESKEAMSEETAYAMISLMQGVVDGVYSPHEGKKSGTGVRLRFKYKFDNEIAGKTGTTQNNSDGWFVGITPDLVTGVWVGGEDRGIRFSKTSLGQGANTSLPIWALYMKEVYADTANLQIYPRKFERPEKPIGIELDCDKMQNKHFRDRFQPDFGFDR